MRVDGQTSLQDARPAIEFLGYKMDRTAMPFVAGIENSLVSIQPRILGQEGRVNIKDLAFVVAYECGTQYAHESGKNQQLGIPAIEFGDDRAIE